MFYFFIREQLFFLTIINFFDKKFNKKNLFKNKKMAKTRKKKHFKSLVLHMSYNLIRRVLKFLVPGP